MTLPKTEQTPDDPQHLPAARRRRAQRKLLPLTPDEREAFLDEIAQRTSPSFDFFLFSVLAGLTVGIGLLLDLPALLVLGAVLAPTMAPLVGIALGAISGSAQFFGRNLLGLVMGSGLVFIASLSLGLIARNGGIFEITQAYLHTRIAWHHFVVLTIGSALTTIAIARGGKRTAVASVALAYEIYVPLCAAGYGLGSGTLHLWPDGLVVFIIHMAWAIILSTFTLVMLGFRPLTLFGYTAGGMLSLIGLVLIIGLGGAGAAVGGQVAIPTARPSKTPTPSLTFTPTLSPTITETPPPATVTLHVTLTASITPSPTITLPPSPTPVYARVNAPEEYGGAILRSEPGFDGRALTSFLNGTLIELLSDVPAEADNRRWLNVRLPGGPEGWMLQSVISVATPVPNW
ncbi:MAG: DUF389 domain-containing protein [Anaerolineae bacterium]|nr:DUF389 domain-containing protein [Anaerolineae bacterium]